MRERYGILHCQRNKFLHFVQVTNFFLDSISIEIDERIFDVLVLGVKFFGFNLPVLEYVYS